MFGNFEYPQPKIPEVVEQDTHESVGEILSAQDILEQLEASENRYVEAIGNLREGDDSDSEFLEEMQASLVSFKNALDDENEITPQIEDARSRVLERLFELSELLETIEEGESVTLQ